MIMAGHSGLGGGGIFCDQILFHRKSKFRRVSTWKYNVWGIKLETKKIRLHEIQGENISSLLLNKYAVHNF